jgi:hypothetical protein
VVSLQDDQLQSIFMLLDKLLKNVKCNKKILVCHSMTWKRFMTEYQENYYGKPSESKMLNNQLHK